MTFEHTTVMVHETLDALDPTSSRVYADTTLGGAGHAAAILEATAPDGRLIGIDRDPAALAAARERLAPYGQRATLVHGEMRDLRRILEEAGVPRVHGVVADLGVSSPQLDDAGRGFSFGSDGPLDMRMDPTSGETVLELIGRLDEKELADVIYRLGEERRSRPIARSIYRMYDRGELSTTADLSRAVIRVTGPRRSRTNPATRTFQALRMAVNEELEQLQGLVRDLPHVLEDGGIAVIISFHSLEDRIVKHAFRGDDRLVPLTKKPVVPSEEEQRDNPRARSSKLRAARRAAREEAA